MQVLSSREDKGFLPRNVIGKFDFHLNVIVKNNLIVQNYFSTI